MGTEAAGLIPPAAPGHPLAVWALLAALAFLAHFLLVGSFGLYADDYFFYARAMALDAAGLGDWITQVIRHWPQGRPVGFALSVTLAWAACAIGGLLAMYAVGYAIVVLNACLLHRLATRHWGPTIGLLAAAFFVLLPADSTRQLLTHNLILQPALTFALLGLLLYTGPFTRRRRIAAYAIAALALLTYESPFLLFIMAPLLARPRARIRAWGVHWLICGLLVAAAVAIRLAHAETRIMQLDTAGTALPLRVLGSLVIGPATVLHQSVAGFIADLARWAPRQGAIVLVGALPALPVIVLLLRLLGRRAPTTPHRARSAIMLALLLLPVSYLLAFTHYPPTARRGGGTSVHLAASVPAALLLAGIAALPLNAARGRGRERRRGSGRGSGRGRAIRTIITAALALFLAAAIAYGIVVQRGYVRAFAAQRTLWSQILAACPDLTADSVVLLIGTPPSPSHFAQPAAAETPLVLRLLFDWPGDLLPPFGQPTLPTALLFADTAAIANHLAMDDAGLYWRTAPHWTVSAGERLPADPIVLRIDPRTVQRIESPLPVGPLTLTPRPVGPPIAPPPTLPLYDLLIDWTYLAPAGPFTGFDAAADLSPPAGPFPEHRLPRVRSATAAATTLRFTAPAAGQAMLVIDATSVLPNQRLTLRLNGRSLATESLPQWTFRRVSVPLPARAGENTLEIEYAATDSSRPRIVHYARLQVLWKPSP